MEPVNPFKVAVIQDAPVFLNIERSIEKADRLTQEAAGAGAKIIAFPETWLPGYPVWLDYAPKAALWDYAPAKELYRILVQNSLSIPGKHFQQLLSIAKKTDAYLIMGVHERRDGTLYNTMIFVHRNGKDCLLHRKLVPTYTERLVWGRGDGSTFGVLETELGNIGGLVCWEHWMPLARAAMHSFNELVHVAQWPAVKDLHQIASRHYAFEGQCFVLAAGCLLTKKDVLEGLQSTRLASKAAMELLTSMDVPEDGVIHNGGSAIIAPDSTYIKGPAYNEESIIYAEINPNLALEGHLFIDTNGHYSRPDVFCLTMNTQSQPGIFFRDSGTSCVK